MSGCPCLPSPLGSDGCPKEQALGAQILLPFGARPRAGAHPTRTESQLDTEQTTHTTGWLEKPNFPGELTVPLVHMLWSGSKEQTKQYCPGLCINLQMSQLTSGFHPFCTPFSCLLHALNVCANFARLPVSKTGLCSPAQQVATPAPGRSRGLSSAPVDLPALCHLHLAAVTPSWQISSPFLSAPRAASPGADWGHSNHHGKHTGYAILS